MGSYDILNEISEHVTLFQLIDYLGNVYHDISVVSYWIFDSNYEKALGINRELLDMIRDLSFGEEKVADFETVFTEVLCIWSTVHLNKELLWYISLTTDSYLTFLAF